MEESLYLTKFGSKVHIVHRRDKLRASKIMAERALEHPKIEVLWNRIPIKVEGKQVVEKIILQDTVTGKEEEHPASGVFFAIGHQPNTAFLKDQIELHETGYIKVKPGTCYTNIEGVFAAGDVFDHTYRQAVTAAGSGCMAAIDAERWLSLQGRTESRVPPEELKVPEC
jgi:thioredoxin reductase (NADPH)